MGPISILITGLVVIFLGGIVILPKGRFLLKGFTNLFIQNMAKTAEGAEAIYCQAIEEAQENYNKSDDNLLKIAGKLETAQNNYNDTTKKIADCEKKCELFASKNQYDKVELYAQERENLLELLATYDAGIKKFTPMKEEAEYICNQYEKTLKKLKSEKTAIINELIMNQQAKEMYDDLNELKHVKESSKLVESVKTNLIESRELATGAKEVHNNKLSTKLIKADQEAIKLQNSDYIEQLKQKYSQK